MSKLKLNFQALNSDEAEIKDVFLVKGYYDDVSEYILNDGREGEYAIFGMFDSEAYQDKHGNYFINGDGEMIGTIKNEQIEIFDEAVPVSIQFPELDFYRNTSYGKKIFDKDAFHQQLFEIESAELLDMVPFMKERESYTINGQVNLLDRVVSTQINDVADGYLLIHNEDAFSEVDSPFVVVKSPSLIDAVSLDPENLRSNYFIDGYVVAEGFVSENGEPLTVMHEGPDRKFTSFFVNSDKFFDTSFVKVIDGSSEREIRKEIYDMHEHNLIYNDRYQASRIDLNHTIDDLGSDVDDLML